MKKYHIAALLWLLLGVAAASSPYSKDKDKDTVGRMLMTFAEPERALLTASKV